MMYLSISLFAQLFGVLYDGKRNNNDNNSKTIKWINKFFSFDSCVTSIKFEYKQMYSNLNWTKKDVYNITNDKERASNYTA